MMGIQMTTQGSSDSLEASALPTHGPNLNHDSYQSRRNGRPWCEHCKKPGHTKDTCWKIRGKLADWKPRAVLQNKGESRGLIATGEEKPAAEDMLLSQEQLKFLQKLINQQNVPQTIGIGTMTQKVISPQF